MEEDAHPNKLAKRTTASWAFKSIWTAKRKTVKNPNTKKVDFPQLNFFLRFLHE